MMSVTKSLLRKVPVVAKLSQINQEGWVHAFKRLAIQNKILSSSPIQTDRQGDREVRVLSWHRDYVNLIWCLKSFYHFSKCSYPLYIHDGGLQSSNKRVLLEHFPSAHIVSQDEADQEVEKLLKGRKLCLEYRRKNIATRKVFDFFLLSRAKSILSLDSDILFFEKPIELLGNSNGPIYNEDFQHAYSIPIAELKKDFKIDVIDRINSGLFLCPNPMFDYDEVERWLSNSKLFEDKWVTEQTLHALAASKRQGALLPKTYLVSVAEGIPDGTICKHYPGFFRPYLYEEGMPRLKAVLLS